jgi:hypothetical protein
MRTPALAAVAIAALGLAVGGCGDDATTTTPSTPGGTGTAAAPPGNVAECVVGDWRSTGANATARGGGASVTLTGGAGVTVKITDAGAATVDFSGMQPADFTAQVAGAQVRGRFKYSGKATGTIRTGEASAGAPTATGTTGPTVMPTMTWSATASPTASPTGAATTGATGAATSGTWEPVPPIDWGDVRVTVDLTQPVQARPFDNVRIGEVLGGGVDQTGDVVDVNPLFGRGGYECNGNTLMITPDDEGGLGWILARA